MGVSTRGRQIIVTAPAPPVSANVVSWLAPTTSVKRAKLGMLKNRTGATHDVGDRHEGFWY